MTTAQIRKVLRTHFGARHYRITSAGEIHVYGCMPNTNEDGWYFFGYIGNPETEARIDDLA